MIIDHNFINTLQSMVHRHWESIYYDDFEYVE